MAAFSAPSHTAAPIPAPGVKHTIHLIDPRPRKQRARRQSPKNHQVTESTVRDLLRKKVIERSNSPWSSPVVIVPKPHNPIEKRMCIDFRQLNSQTQKDAYPVPLIEDCLDMCKNADWFSIIDIKDAFWHIEMDEDSIPLTAFVTADGLFHWKRMPFGLTNAPATFQRYVDHVLREHIGKYCAAFFDDCLVYTTGTLEEHIKHVKAVLATLAAAGLEVRVDKSKFAFTEVTYVGYVISKGKVHPEPSLIRGIQEFATPTNIKELRQFLGLTNYYRKFVRGFAHIAVPLYQLTKKGTVWAWTGPRIAAFEALKAALISSSCLYAPDHSKPFVLQTDASDVGIGAVLEQEHDHEFHPVAFISRKLNDAETRYSGTERECLAVVWAVGQFEHYLIDQPFTVVTDHSALQWLPQKKFDNNRLMRWALKLQEFTFTVRHRAGAANANADALSRLPPPNSAPADDDKRDPAVGPLDRELRHLHQLRTESCGNTSTCVPRYIRLLRGEIPPFPLVLLQRQDTIATLRKSSAALCTGSDGNDEDLSARRIFDIVLIDESQLLELAQAQRKDKELQLRIDFLENKHIPAGWLPADVVKFRKQCDDFVLVPQAAPCPPVLKYYPSKPKVGLASFTPVHPRVAVPSTFRTRLLKLFHDSPFGGHFGIKRTIRKIAVNYWWPSLQQDVTDYVSSCEACSREKQRRRSPILPVGSAPQPAYPFHIISIDHVGPLEKSEDFKFILVIIDHFSRWAIAVPVLDTSAETTALALYEEVYNRFGVPKMLLSDQGPAFCNAVIAALHLHLGVHHLFTSAYHPESNGAVERLNGTLKQILYAVTFTHGSQWVQVLQPAVFAYNTSRSETIGFSPYYVLFGREAVTPGDQAALLADSMDIDYTGENPLPPYIEQLLQDLKECHDVVRAIFDSKLARAQEERLKLARIPVYSVGDQVWIRDPKSEIRFGKQKGHRAPWIGPGTITKRISDFAYRVDITTRSVRTGRASTNNLTVHTARMKPVASRSLIAADLPPGSSEPRPDDTPVAPRPSDIPVPRPGVRNHSRSNNRPAVAAVPSLASPVSATTDSDAMDITDDAPAASTAPSDASIILPSHASADMEDVAPAPTTIGESIHRRHARLPRPNYSDDFAARFPVHARQQRFSLPPRRSTPLPSTRAPAAPSTSSSSSS